MSKKILILGSSGLLGSTLVPYLKSRGYNVVSHSRGRTSATDIVFDLEIQFETVANLSKIQPDTIINLVGLTSVELCELYPNLAYSVNTKTVENIVSWIKEYRKNCHLIHISTDHVYDGAGPHAELNITLTNTYAMTKYASELSATQANASIIRTNFVGKSMVSNRESLTDWVFSSLKVHKSVEVLDDVLFSPLSLDSISGVIEKFIGRDERGTFNAGSRQGLSKAEFDFLFAQKLNLNTSFMNKVSCKEAAFLKAYRPKDMRMNCIKLEETFKLKLPLLTDEIEKIHHDYN